MESEGLLDCIKNEKITTSKELGELFGALAKAQGAMSAAAKDSTNPFFNSKYADLSSVWNACREATSQNGLCVVQTTGTENNELCLITTLGHSSGQWVRSSIPIKVKIPEPPEVDKYGKTKKVNELQLLGSYFTYLRRYTLSAIVGVAPDEDDDGNKGQKKEISNPIPEAGIAYAEPWKLEAKLLSKGKIEEALSAYPDKQLVEEYLTFLVKNYELTYKEWIYKMIDKPKDFSKNMLEWELKNRSALNLEKSA
jgi:hypothetical protein